MADAATSKLREWQEAHALLAAKHQGAPDAEYGKHMAALDPLMRAYFAATSSATSAQKTNSLTLDREADAKAADTKSAATTAASQIEISSNVDGPSATSGGSASGVDEDDVDGDLDSELTSGALWTLAGGLNIEGGFPALDLLPPAKEVMEYKRIQTFRNRGAACRHDCAPPETTSSGDKRSCVERYLRRYPNAKRAPEKELERRRRMMALDAAEFRAINLSHDKLGPKLAYAKMLQKELEVACRPTHWNGVWENPEPQEPKDPKDSKDAKDRKDRKEVEEEERVEVEFDLPARPRWVNLVLVLDRPLVDGVTFDELKRRVVANKWPLLENGMDEIDERGFLTAYVSTLSFYMSRHKSVTIHVHQDKRDARGLIDILKPFVDTLSLKYTCRVEWRTDDPFYNRMPPVTTEILISLSQCAGLSPHFRPGTILIPKQFIPFNINTSTVDTRKAYCAQNDFARDLTDIFLSPSSPKQPAAQQQTSSEHFRFAQMCLSDYESANPDKKRTPVKLPTGPNFWLQFEESNILQASFLWNPTSPNQPVRVR